MRVKTRRSYKFRIYPDKEQAASLVRTFGCVRFIYNKMLSNRIEIYNRKINGDCDVDEKPKTYTDFKREFEWLYEVDNLALANAQINVRNAYANFFRDKRIGFPKFKSKKNNKDSYTTNNLKNGIRIQNGRIRIKKIGWIKIKQHREMPKGSRIKAATISRSASGKYYVSILTECEREQPCEKLNKDRAVGLDYSSPHFYVDSQGVVADMPHFFREAEDKLAREQRKLSKMFCGSKNYEKQRVKVARAHEHVANQRKDWLHKKSTELANRWDYVCVEDINLRGMAGSLNLGKSTQDNGFGMFREMLKYKLSDRGKVLIKIGKWFPSSKMCHVCGAINKELTLKDRIWTCECGVRHDRDLNAAINIRDRGIL